MLGGYNQDRAEVIEADTACHVVTAGPALLVHDCAGTRGTSGGPVLMRGPDGVWRVAGMQVGALQPVRRRCGRRRPCFRMRWIRSGDAQ